MTKTTTDIENFQYHHIFNLILGIFIGKAPLKRINYLDNLF